MHRRRSLLSMQAWLLLYTVHAILNMCILFRMAPYNEPSNRMRRKWLQIFVERYDKMMIQTYMLYKMEWIYTKTMMVRLCLIRPKRTEKRMSTWPVLTWPGWALYNSFASHFLRLWDVNLAKIECVEVRKLKYYLDWVLSFLLLYGCVRAIPTYRVYWLYDTILPIQTNRLDWPYANHYPKPNLTLFLVSLASQHLVIN